MLPEVLAAESDFRFPSEAIVIVRTHLSHQISLLNSRVARSGVLSLCLAALCASHCSAQTTARIIVKRDKSTPAKLSYFLRTSNATDFNPMALPDEDKILLLDVTEKYLASDTTLFLVDNGSQRVAQFPLPNLAKEQKRTVELGELEPNLIRNGQFQGGTHRWKVVPATSGITLSTSKVKTDKLRGKALELQIGENAGADTALVIDAVQIANNRDYLLKFIARADKPRIVRLALRLDGSDETTGLNEDKALSTEWQEYTIKIKSTRTSPVNKPQRVTFIYEGDANKVYLAGNFNDWNTSANLMERDSNGKKWRTTLTLAPGNYEYKFLADEQWTSDSNAPMKEDGNRNNTLQVGSVYPVQLIVKPGTQVGSVQIGDVRLQLKYTPKFATQEITAAGNEFNRASTVSIPIRLDSRPVTGITVELEAEGMREPFIVRPDNNGMATFRNVPINTLVKITVKGGTLQKVVTDSIKNEGATELGVIALTSEWSGVVTLAGASSLSQIAGTTAKEEGNSKVLLILGVVAGALLAALGGLMYTINVKRRNELTMLPQSSRLPGQITHATTAVVPIGAGARQPVSALASKTNTTLASPSVMSGVPQFTGVQGTYGGYTFELNGEHSQIGRDITSTVALPQDSNVSRQHATLHIVEGEYILTDEGSSNGTFVNGQRLPSNTPHPIKSGDEIEFGSSRFRFEA